MRLVLEHSPHFDVLLPCQLEVLLRIDMVIDRK